MQERTQTLKCVIHCWRVGRSESEREREDCDAPEISDESDGWWQGSLRYFICLSCKQVKVHDDHLIYLNQAHRNCSFYKFVLIDACPVRVTILLIVIVTIPCAPTASVLPPTPALSP